MIHELQEEDKRTIAELLDLKVHDARVNGIATPREYHQLIYLAGIFTDPDCDIFIHRESERMNPKTPNDTTAWCTSKLESLSAAQVHGLVTHSNEEMLRALEGKNLATYLLVFKEVERRHREVSAARYQKKFEALTVKITELRELTPA